MSSSRNPVIKICGTGITRKMGFVFLVVSLVVVIMSITIHGIVTSTIPNCKWQQMNIINSDDLDDKNIKISYNGFNKASDIIQEFSWVNAKSLTICKIDVGTLAPSEPFNVLYYEGAYEGLYTYFISASHSIDRSKSMIRLSVSDQHLRTIYLTVRRNNTVLVNTMLDDANKVYVISSVPFQKISLHETDEFREISKTLIPLCIIVGILVLSCIMQKLCGSFGHFCRSSQRTTQQSILGKF